MYCDYWRIGYSNPRFRVLFSNTMFFAKKWSKKINLWLILSMYPKIKFRVPPIHLWLCVIKCPDVRLGPKKKILVNWPTHISLNPFQITHDTTQIRKKNNQIKFTYYFILCNLKGVQIFLSTEFDSNFTFIINFTQYE